MQQKIGFGTALTDGGFQYMATQDPNPRIPFTHGFGPGTEPRMKKWEKIGWSFAIGFWAAFVMFCSVPW